MKFNLIFLKQFSLYYEIITNNSTMAIFRKRNSDLKLLYSSNYNET